ncbi:MAG: Crp/Fnr family transcriptional regulator [Mucilaginibacter sp.]|uniref:Crp/Fnr family transcriptional regulator n=1 Tax=Mucilaginibacter sp. TaxID=1882438 RepID=UPI0031A4AEB7
MQSDKYAVIGKQWSGVAKPMIIKKEKLSESGQILDEAALCLFNFISDFSEIPLSESEKEHINLNLKVKTLRRGDYLLQEGDICRYHWFVVKGAIRMLSINVSCREYVLAFRTENNWVTESESLSQQSPSRYYIEAMERTQVLQLNANCMETLRNDIPAWAEMLQKHEYEQAIVTQRRINSVINMTAEERYRDMLISYPYYEQRFSQHMLAAYLGIQPETLCRIRKN